MIGVVSVSLSSTPNLWDVGRFFGYFCVGVEFFGLAGVYPVRRSKMRAVMKKGRVKAVLSAVW